MAQTGSSHLGPDWDCTLVNAEHPNQTFAGSSLFMNVTLQSALVHCLAEIGASNNLIRITSIVPQMIPVNINK
jgi:hypothetical protein